MVSVIVPVYNAEATIEKCVESLVYGFYQDLEILLIDDCSTDNSWQICQNAEKRFTKVRCFQNKENSGVSFTRNHGLEEAKGELVAFVDSDDWVSGRYLQKLTECYQGHPKSLVICGHHFIDRTVGYERDYLWTSENDDHCYMAHGAQLFELADAFLLQQVWNKLFEKRIIDQYALRFDVRQSMGEDYQFVLEYLDKSTIDTYTIINEPLYYYIRANQTSLMSHFGLSNVKKEEARLEKILQICREDSEAERKYQRARGKIKENAVYHIFRNSSISKNEKKDRIREIVGNEQFESCYRHEQIIAAKEKTAEALSKMKGLPSVIKGKATRILAKIRIARAKSQLKNTDVTVISQNCIGGVFYHDMGLQFTSPTINLFFSSLDFLRFAGNLKYYLNQPLTLQWEEQYPVGHLDDISIHFQHYGTCTEAKEAWERRKERILPDKIIILSTDRDGFKEEDMNCWEKIDYPKILFSSEFRGREDVIFYPKWAKDGQVGDLISGRSFYKQHKLIEMINQL